MHGNGHVDTWLIRRHDGVQESRDHIRGISRFSCSYLSNRIKPQIDFYNYSWSHICCIFMNRRVTMNARLHVYTEKGNASRRVSLILISRLILDLGNVFQRVQKTRRTDGGQRGVLPGFTRYRNSIASSSDWIFMEILEESPGIWTIHGKCKLYDGTTHLSPDVPADLFIINAIQSHAFSSSL